MDPNTCLWEFLEAIECGDKYTAVERLEDLARWIDSGGFLPQVKKIDIRTWWVPEKG